MHLYISVTSPYQWVKYNPLQGTVAESGSVKTLDKINLSNDIDRIIGVANGTDIVSHKIKIPGKHKKNILDAIPFALEEDLTDDIEDLHFALQNWAPNELSEVLVTKDQLIQNWLKTFSQAGISLNDLVPEYLLVPIHPSADVTIAKTHDDNFQVKLGNYMGTSVDASLMALWWETEAKGKSMAINDEKTVKALIAKGFDNCSHWKIGTQLPSWLRHGGAKNLVFPCLLQGKYDQTQEIKSNLDIKKGIGFSIAGVVLYIFALFANYFYLEIKSLRLTAQASIFYTNAFPDAVIKNPKDPVFEMRRSISSLKSGNYGTGNFLPILQILTSQLRKNNVAEIENIVFEDNILSVQITVSNFQAMDIIETNLSQAMNTYALVSIEDKISQEGETQGLLKIALNQQ